MAKKVALVVADVQHDFVSGSFAIAGADEIIPDINELQEQEQTTLDEIVVATDWQPADHCSFRAAAPPPARFLRPHRRRWPATPRVRGGAAVAGWGDPYAPAALRGPLRPGHRGGRARGGARVRVREGRFLVRKGARRGIDSYSAFFDNLRQHSTGLGDELVRRGVGTVLVCGLALQGCVAATARHAAELGFTTFVVPEASRGGDENTVLAELRGQGVGALSTAEVLARWPSRVPVSRRSSPTSAVSSGPLLRVAVLCAALQAGCGQHPLSSSDCAAAATTTATELACADVAQRLAAPTGAASEDQPCPGACAELWIGASSRCTGKSSTAFEAAAPPRMTAACGGTAASLLATAPRSITVTGLACHAAANAEYLLQPAPLNNRPHYATVDAGSHMYWTSQFGEGACWLIDADTDDSVDLSVTAKLISATEAAPTGSAVWCEFCSSIGWTNTRLQLTPNRPDASRCASALITLAPRLTAICCGPEDGAGCGQNGAVPSECSPDCAHLWRPYAEQCPGAIDLGNLHLTAFFDDECGAADAALTVLRETVTIPEWQTHGFEFEARSGTRYSIDVRVDDGSGQMAQCASNAYDRPPRGHLGDCDETIASGQSSCTDSDMGPNGPYAHYCDASCGFLCAEDGVKSTVIFVLPPGATDDNQAVVSQTSVAADKGIAFTASATGTFTARVLTSGGSVTETSPTMATVTAESSGPVTVTATAVGRALERSPELRADGLSHPLGVRCRYLNCAFEYDSVTTFDGDGSGFDLVLPDAEAGRAYALLVELPPGQAAAQVKATFFQSGAAAGAAGFEPAVVGPMGEWTTTPAGHKSFAEHYGCTDGDVSCWAMRQAIRQDFGMHAGGVFSRFLRGTWVAPSSGAVLLRLLLNCDVPFYADQQAEGCEFNPNDQSQYRCSGVGTGGGGTGNGDCASELQLTVTPGAFFDSDDAASTEPVSGSAERTDTIAVTRVEIEAQVRTLWQDTPTEQHTLSASPTLEQMLVQGTEANAFLNSLFSKAQQPHLVYPLSMELSADAKGHRRMQHSGGRLAITIDTHAPTPAEADQAVRRLAADTGGSLSPAPPGKGRRLQTSGGDLYHTTDAHAVCGLGSTEAGCTAAGQTKRQTRLLIGRDEIEAVTSDKFTAMPVDERTMPTAPTLDEMLVSGTPANALLSSVFAEEQEPHVTFPVDASRQSNGCEGHRRLQVGGDHLHITIETHAATPAAADAAVRRLARDTGGVVCT